MLTRQTSSTLNLAAANAFLDGLAQHRELFLEEAHRLSEDWLDTLVYLASGHFDTQPEQAGHFYSAARLTRTETVEMAELRDRVRIGSYPLGSGAVDEEMLENVVVSLAVSQHRSRFQPRVEDAGKRVWGSFRRPERFCPAQDMVEDWQKSETFKLLSVMAAAKSKLCENGAASNPADDFRDAFTAAYTTAAGFFADSGTYQKDLALLLVLRALTEVLPYPARILHAILEPDSRARRDLDASHQDLKHGRCSCGTFHAGRQWPGTADELCGAIVAALT